MTNQITAESAAARKWLSNGQLLDSGALREIVVGNSCTVVSSRVNLGDLGRLEHLPLRLWNLTMNKMLFFAGALLALACQSADASIVIDNFAAGYTSPSGAMQTGAGSSGSLALTGDVTGSKTVSFAGFVPGGFFDAISMGGGNINFTAAAFPGVSPTESMTLAYSFAAPLNLEVAPLQLDLFDSVTGSFNLAVTYLSTAFGNSTTNLVITSAGAINLGPGLFAANVPTSVDGLSLIFTRNTYDPNGIGGSANFNAAGASISAVPEPASVCLGLASLTLGAFGVRMSRRRAATQQTVA